MIVAVLCAIRLPVEKLRLLNGRLSRHIPAKGKVFFAAGMIETVVTNIYGPWLQDMLQKSADRSVDRSGHERLLFSAVVEGYFSFFTADYPLV
ncbi:MAG: hypothetical protein SWO11_14310 [Thermodesulfobacteriota bacterium]|nr:hypothetical protein [Thermodesulfobacteriota bacterium]